MLGRIVFQKCFENVSRFSLRVTARTANRAQPLQGLACRRRLLRLVLNDSDARDGRSHTCRHSAPTSLLVGCG